jgi:hypothetical protein
MNTKLLMTSSSVVLALAGVFALFVPDVLLPQDRVNLEQMSVLVQLMGALYFAFALMNWTAKDSAIGGIYARPVSLANFGHFFVGTLLLAKHQLSNEFNIFILVALVVYALFAAFFYWLVFRATGLSTTK